MRLHANAIAILRETPCESLARYPALQQGEENDKGSVLLVREHLHAAVDLKILFKAHERKELQLPLYLRLQIVWECAQALRALHRAGLGHGDLKLSSIKVTILPHLSHIVSSYKALC
jgi:serine/threonine protein kinase